MPEKSDNVSCSNNAAPVIVHAIRVTYFPEKSSVNLCIYEKFSFFLFAGSLYKCLKNLPMFLVPAMLFISHCSCYSCNTFPGKNQV